jgi:tRNA A37 N6-isopentenylltransferase MiaA
MLSAGLLEEVRLIRERRSVTRGTSVDARGRISATMAAFSGTMCVEEAQQQAVAATRQLAKRQLTWLRRRSVRSGSIPCILKLHRRFLMHCRRADSQNAWVGALTLKLCCASIESVCASCRTEVTRQYK